jgi:putative cardiolipin synthase
MTPFENAQFLFDDPTQDPTVMSFKFKFQAITQDFLQVLATARESIVIQTPYLFPSDETKLLLASLIRDRGVKIKIITNSILTTNNLLAEVGYKSVRHELIQMGIELYEYKGPQTAHAKAALIDGKIFFIGSFNLDYRSALLNREVALVGESVAVAQELNTIITQRYQANSRLVGRDGHPVGDDSVWDANVGMTEILKLQQLKLLLPEIKDQI